MKTDLLARYLCIIVLFLSISSCKDDDSSDSDVQTQKLTGTWHVGQQGYAKRDGIASNEWNDFTLTFAEGRYTTTNTHTAVWPGQGTWKFHPENVNHIVREDGMLIDIAVTDTTLQLSFTQPETSASGRTSGVSGQYVFLLYKQ